MIETCNGTNGTRNGGQKTNFNNDPFFGVVDEFDSGGLDDFDGTDYFGMLADDRNTLMNETDFNGLDDLQLTADAFLSSIPPDRQNDSFLSPAISTSSDGQHSSTNTTSGTQRSDTPQGDLPPPPSPIVIDPNEIDKISIQLEKNQQCRCKSCNKLFNSVWYLKQHAVKHSNDRPFKCKFCMKTYKFRSNLYQHKCPERNRQLGGPGGIRKRFYARGIAYTEVKSLKNSEIDTNSGKKSNSNIQIIPQKAKNCEIQNEIISSTISTDNQNFENTTNFDNNNFSNSNSTILFDLIPVEIPQMKQTKFEKINDESKIIEKNNLPSKLPNCIRERPLDPAYVEKYLQKNKDRLFTCKKCKLQLPTREHLNRHMTGHTLSEYYCFLCPQCPQKFCEERKLRNHLELHSNNPMIVHKCKSCDGGFRSALALRRHRDQSRMCCLYPFGIEPGYMISSLQPIDPYGFIESDDENDGILKQKSSKIDSNVESNNFMSTSPLILEENEKKLSSEFTIPIKRTKKSSENEDADSGFRSRLNSVQSCSPDTNSDISSGGDSPGRKYSNFSNDFIQPGTNFNNFQQQFTNNNYYSQTRPSTSTSMNHSSHPSSSTTMNYDLLEINVENNFYDFDGELLFSTPNFKRTKIILPKKLPELTIDSFDFDFTTNSENDFDNNFLNDFDNFEMFDPLFFFETQCQITSPMNYDDNNSEFPLDDGYDIEPDKENPDEETIKACLAIFLNTLIQNAKTKNMKLKKLE